MKYEYKKQTITKYIEQLYKYGFKKSSTLSDKCIEQRVKSIGIFRLKGYVQSFREHRADYYIDDLFDLYDVDREISINMFNIASSIETTLKTYLIEIYYKHTNNPFIYLCEDSYQEGFILPDNVKNNWHNSYKSPDNNKEVYKHYREYYLSNYSFQKNKDAYLKNKKLIICEDDNINYPPFHYFIESLTLGSLIKIIENLNIDKKSILWLLGKEFNFNNKQVFLRYLLRLRELRNRCAHNERLFNRNFHGVKAIGKHHEFRKTIYDKKLLDLYYSLKLLQNGGKNIYTDTNELKDDFKTKILKNKNLEDFIMRIITKQV